MVFISLNMPELGNVRFPVHLACVVLIGQTPVAADYRMPQPVGDARRFACLPRLRNGVGDTVRGKLDIVRGGHDIELKPGPHTVTRLVLGIVALRQHPLPIVPAAGLHAVRRQSCVGG